MGDYTEDSQSFSCTSLCAKTHIYNPLIKAVGIFFYHLRDLKDLKVFLSSGRPINSPMTLSRSKSISFVAYTFKGRKRNIYSKVNGWIFY